MKFTLDMYYLAKDYLSETEKAIAIFHNGDKPTFMGFFDQTGEFHHTGECAMGIADCRAIVEVADEIDDGKFEELYNEAREDDEIDEEIEKEFDDFGKQLPENVCRQCGQSFATHNDDGSCVKD